MNRLAETHTAPWHVAVDGKPLRPRRSEAEYPAKGVEEPLQRGACVAPEVALAEYRDALRVYKQLEKAAR
jgi:hypothetical protein